MKHPSSALFPLLALCVVPSLRAQDTAAVATAETGPKGAPAAIREIDADDLMKHASWLADDARGGRLTGSPGQYAAAKYITDHFASLGLDPGGDIDPETNERGFIQRYPLVRTSLADDTHIKVGGAKWQDGFALLSGGGTVQVALDGSLQFFGFGRTRGTTLDVPEGTDFSEVVPVILARLPRGRMNRPMGIEQKFMTSFTALGSLSRNVQGLARAGATAVIVALPEDPLGLMDVLNTMTVAPGKDLMTPGNWKQGGDPMGGMVRMLLGSDGIPMVFISPARTQELMAAMQADADEVLALARRERPDLPESSPVDGGLHLATEVDREAYGTNVVAVLPGSDLPDEALVYSAHMDHVGIRLDGDVFNGADDNASGSAGLLEIAEAFAKSEEKPRRSVVFLSVSGEELGLWGSEFFADHSTWPVAKIIADINTDMIGRSGPESGDMEVTVTPSFDHPHFSSMVQDAAVIGKEFGMAFSSGDKYYERSDHYNFARKDIPVVFFCNGEHEDYHQVTDHADKLNAPKMERIARIAFWTGWKVANADDAPKTLGRSDGW